MEIKEQEYILSIARHENLKDAAADLNITQPGLSIFLSTLEKKTGIRLFHRVGKHFVPTDAGNLYLFYAKQMSSFKHEYNAKISDLRNEVSGKMNIGLQVIRSSYALVSTLSAFDKRYPHVDVGILESDNEELLDKLLSGELDLIVVNRVVPSSALNYRQIYQDRLVCLLPPEAAESQLGSSIAGETLKYLDLKVLSGKRFILPHPELATRIYADKAIAYSHARPGKTITIKNLDMIALMAAEGLGVGFSLYSIFRHFSYPKPLCAFMVGDPGVFPSYYIVSRKDRYLPRFTTFFMDVLENAYQFQHSNAT